MFGLREKGGGRGYAGMNVLERTGVKRVLSVDEQKADMRVLEVHPFLPAWRDV